MGVQQMPDSIKAMNPQELLQLAASAKPIDGPTVSASTAIVSIAGNDAVLIFQRPRPLLMPDGTFGHIALSETTAIIHLSLATLKDMSIVLTDTVAHYEKQFGEIKTDYTRRRDAEKK